MLCGPFLFGKRPLLSHCQLSLNYGSLNPKTLLKPTMAAADSSADRAAPPQSTRRSRGIQSRSENTSNGRTGNRYLAKSQAIMRMVIREQEKSVDRGKQGFGLIHAENLCRLRGSHIATMPTNATIGQTAEKTKQCPPHFMKG